MMQPIMRNFIMWRGTRKKHKWSFTPLPRNKQRGGHHFAPFTLAVSFAHSLFAIFFGRDFQRIVFLCHFSFASFVLLNGAFVGVFIDLEMM